VKMVVDRVGSSTVACSVEFKVESITVGSGVKGEENDWAIENVVIQIVDSVGLGGGGTIDADFGDGQMVLSAESAGADTYTDGFTVFGLDGPHATFAIADSLVELVCNVA